jgi:ABC-2 type transport system permease protein
MTLLESPALAAAARTGSTPLLRFRAEIMKIRTTSTWWIFGVGVMFVTGQALVRNGASHHYDLYPTLDGLDAQSRAHFLAIAAQARTHAGTAAIAGDMMTSGQFLGVLFAMIIGVLVATNEYVHQTATATYLANPRRGTVIRAKFAAAAYFGIIFWLVSTVIDLVVTPIYLRSQHLHTSLADWVVVRSVLLNLAAYAMWAIFGLGLGTLIRSQIGSVITAMGAYLVGAAAVTIIFQLIYHAYPHAWIKGATAIAPAVASLVMTTPGRAFDHAPPQWAGAVIMLGYTLLFGTIGIMLTRRRDVT